MKNVTKWMTILMVAIVGVSFASCGDDEVVAAPASTDPQTVVDGGLASIAGVWEWRKDSEYFIATITADGAYSVTAMVDGKQDSGSGKCSIKEGYLYLTGARVEKVKIVSQTATTLVLKDWPVSGNCTWTKKQ